MARLGRLSTKTPRAVALSAPGYVGLCLVLCLEVSGCTRLLGIDGEYQLDAGFVDREGGGTLGGAGGAPNVPGAAGGVISVGSGGSGNAGGRGAGGLLANATGGAKNRATGGAATVADAGEGGVSAGDDAGLGACLPGRYSGTYSGSHLPSFATTISLPANGTVNLQVGPVINSSAKVTGSLTGNINATINGTLDCDAATGSGTLLNAVFNYSPAPEIPIEGTLTLTIDGPGAISGDLNEYEDPGGIKNGGKGTATLIVSRYQ